MTASKVVDHRLVWDDDEVELVHGEPDKWLPEITPEIVVIHYGVTHTLDSLVAAQRARGYWAHLSIDGGHDREEKAYYRVHQQRPFNARGAHAGKSSYQGRKAVNNYSVGIEIANPGPLLRKADGRLYTVYGKLWEEEEAIFAHRKGDPRAWKHWAVYTDQEIDILVDVVHALKRAYPTIHNIVGHDEISPGRKFDPGPAFPMNELRKELF